MNMKKDQSHTTQIISRGKLTTKNPTIFYCILSMDHEISTMPFSSHKSLQNSVICLTLSSQKTDQYLVNFQPPDSLPLLCNPWWSTSLKDRNSYLPLMFKYHGHSNGWLVACVQANNVTSDSQIPFHLELNWVCTGSDMHATNNSKSSISCEITTC